MGSTRKPFDLNGMKFGRLTVISFYAKMYGSSSWLCQCDCGNTKVVYGPNLRNGVTKSCGCLIREFSSANGKKNKTHGLTKSSIWRSWQAMKARCCNKHHRHFDRYGGRGITVCERWRTSFQNFLDDMGARPEGKSLDRIDNDGNYEPGNCRWATMKQQSRNRRSNAFRLIFGETKTIVEWAEDARCQVSHATFQQRLEVGWDAQKALTEPPEIPAINFRDAQTGRIARKLPGMG